MEPANRHGDHSTCDRCGREALGVIGDEALCENCWHEAGACCGNDMMEEDKCSLMDKNAAVSPCKPACGL